MTARAKRRHQDRQRRRSAVQAGPAGAPLSPDELVYGNARQLREMAAALRQGDKRASTPLASAAVGRVAAYQKRHPDADLSSLVGRPICEDTGTLRPKTQPKNTTVLFQPCGHSDVIPETVLRVYRKNRISMWCPLCETMRRWIEGRRAGSRRTRQSDRGRAAYGSIRASAGAPPGHRDAPDPAVAPGPRAVRIDAAGPGAAEIWIDDYLEPPNMWGEGISARSVREALDEIGARDVVAHMNSGGGDYFEGVAIYQAFRQHPGSVYMAVDALAASAASVVIMAGDTVGIGDGAFIMVHEASTFAYGNADDLLTRATMLDEVDGQIAQFYARKAGDTAVEWRERMAAETWFGPQAAIDVGLADEDLAPPAVDDEAIDTGDEPEDAAAAEAAAVAELFSIDILRPAAAIPDPPPPDPEPAPDPIDFSALFSADMEDLLL